MKARFLALAALVLGLASCQTEPEGLNVNVGGEQDVTISVSLPETTRANSEEGAFVNVVNSEEYTIRYILQVYYNDTESEADPQVAYSDETSVNFDVRLVPGRDYKFVVWADVVKEADKADWHYNTADLKNITLNGDWNAMDETRDAFTGVELVQKYNGTKSIEVLLTRPFAKLRVMTDDMQVLEDLGLSADLAVVEYATDHYSSFNALTGVPFNKNIEKKKHEISDIKAYDEYGTLFVDYFFATKAQETVKFVLAVYDADEAEPLKVNNFSTDIPVQRNYLTTISGNILTDGNNIKVEVENGGEFAGTENWPNTTAEQLAYAAMFGGEVTLAENVELTQPLTIVDGANVVINLNGKTLKNKLTNEATDVIIVEEGGKLTINGEGTVEAVTGNDGYAVIASGEVVINGGTFKAGVDENGEANAVVYARGNGKVYVDGGNFPNEANSTYVLNKKDADRATTVIEVRGGSFFNFNPADNAAENPGTNFCAEGYGVIKNGDYYNVLFTAGVAKVDAVVNNVNDLNTAMANGGAIVLQAGEYGTIVAKSNVTLIGTEGANVDCVALNAASNFTLKNVKFDAANAKGSYNGDNTRVGWANIVSATEGFKTTNGAPGSNIVIDGCTFTGTFANGGEAIAFTNQRRSNYGSVTIKNCTFDTVGAYYDIYGHYFGIDNFIIENNVFKSEVHPQANPLYFNRYTSSNPIVITGNTFETETSLENAVYLRDHSNYGVSINASNNTFAN